MSSHVLSEVQELCDRVAFIKDGQIIDTTTISRLTENAAKRVIVKLPAGESGPLRKQLKALSGVHMKASVEDYTVSFTYDGKAQPLLRLLSGYDVSDVTIKEPDLEEIFMHYYESTPDVQKATK
jgi:ABC-2 type transport system ATP-binding protein